MCARAATSTDPREIWLAVGVAQNRNGERMRRGREVYSLRCSGCNREIEIRVTERHCPLCKEVLVIEWWPR
jgi:hypothetical protein